MPTSIPVIVTCLYSLTKLQAVVKFDRHLKFQVVHPTKTGVRFVLGDLEAILVRELWEADRPLSVKECQASISKTRSVAVTTVATVLDRLYRKDIVSRKLVKEGPHYIYSVRFTEEEFKHVVVSNVMGALLRGFNDVTVTYLAERMTDSPEDRKVISKYLDLLK